MKHRPLYVRRKCNQNIMGKDVGFCMVSKRQVATCGWENWLVPLYIIYKQRCHNLKICHKWDKIQCFTTRQGAKRLSTKKSTSRTTCLVTHTHEKEWWGSRGWIYNPYDDTLAMTALADSNLPTLLLTDFKIWLLCPFFRHGRHIELLLYVAQSLPAAWR